MPKPTVLIDSRERRPLTVPRNYKSQIVKMGSCDYSLLGYTGTIGIERKSLDDLFATLTRKANKKRFLKQLQRSLKQHELFYVMVQGSAHDVLTYTGKAKGRADARLVLSYLFQLSFDFHFEVLFADVCPRYSGVILCRLFDAVRLSKRPKSLRVKQAQLHLRGTSTALKVKGRKLKA